MGVRICDANFDTKVQEILTLEQKSAAAFLGSAQGNASRHDTQASTFRSTLPPFELRNPSVHIHFSNLSGPPMWREFGSVHFPFS